MLSDDLVKDVSDKLAEIKDSIDDLMSDIDANDVDMRIEFDADCEPLITFEIGLGDDYTVHMSDAIRSLDDDDIDRIISWLAEQKNDA